MKQGDKRDLPATGFCTRRTFLIGSAGTLAAAGAAGCTRETIPDSKIPLKSSQPKTALVLWYSQAGHTERNGRLIGKVLEQNGLAVTALDIRRFDPSAMKDYDLIVLGTPVYYLDTPGNVRSWLASIPDIRGIPVAAYSTFGGPGDNQYNTAFSTLQLLCAKGGVPIGIAAFGNMSTFAPTWSSGKEARILKYRDRPNEETYTQVREFAKQALQTVRSGSTISPVRKEFHYGDVFKGSVMMKFTKLLISRHTIDAAKCIGCGTCVRVCPVGATHPAQHRVDQDRCIACMGCVNNCPAQAIDMVFMGKKVYGFKDFLRKYDIRIQEPKEFQG
ncbi:MAG: 4Fe-4S binding protein [Syntrophaceae bacterium]|nr:4Fe-4S binding protein [Syntrophaceae bacterium]